MIVGQGLAGSVLAYLLLKKGQKVIIIDNYTEGGKKSSSQIAAGVINPITGMRFVKSWRIDEFLPAARSLYTEMESFLSIKLWHERLIIRALRNTEEENNWLLRSTFPDYQPYCENFSPSCVSLDESVNESDYNKFKPFYALAKVKNSAQVNIPALVEHFRHYFKQEKMLLTDHFDTTHLSISKENITYKDLKAKKIIFCEGVNVLKNPYFHYLPFNPDKGELLLVRIPHLNINHIFKNKMTIVPLHDTEGGQKDFYWVGATNTWTFDNDLPTDVTKSLIINELKNTINVPFEVIDHQSAVRPTVKDRRPLLGLHPQHPQLGIFNGFGTKGASLVPFWATHFMDFLLNAKPLDKEVDIQRF